MPKEWYEDVDVERVEPPHHVISQNKLHRLVVEMVENGWVGRPVLVTPGASNLWAQTGSHRIAAAREAGLESIPALMVDLEDVWEELETDVYGCPVLGMDDEDRAAKLAAIGASDASELMWQEVAEGWDC